MNDIQDNFEIFHEKNPHVYVRLVELARALRARGRLRIGIKNLFEVIRWEYYMSTSDPNSNYKLNNNYHSRYARLIMDQESDLAGAFELRSLQS